MRTSDTGCNAVPAISVMLISVIWSITQTVALTGGRMDGDVLLAGLFDLRDAQGEGCGKVSLGTVHEVEAILWTLRKINNHNYIPGVKIGIDYRDTCGKADLALDSLRQILSIHQYQQAANCSKMTNLIYAGIMGPSRSGPAQAVSNAIDYWLDKQQYLQISYSVTASEFSKSTAYPNMVRVIPTDRVQIEVFVELLKRLEWNLIVVLYSDETYGRGGIHDLRSALLLDTSYRICIYKEMAVSTTSHDERQIANFLLEVVTADIRGIVYIGQKEQAERLLAVSNKNHDTGTLQFIFSETSNLLKINLHQYDVVSPGLLTLSPTRNVIVEFQQHWNSIFTDFLYLRTHATENPWLEQILMETGDCFLENTTRYYPQFVGKTPCTEFTPEMVGLRLNESPYLVYAIHAAQLYSYLIKQVYNGPCRANLDHCVNVMASEVIKAANDPNLILDINNEYRFDDAMTNLLFNTIRLDMNGDIIRGNNTHTYDVRNFVRTKDGNFRFEKIGSYVHSSLNVSTPIKMYEDRGTQSLIELSPPGLPKSQCQKECSSCLVRPLSEEILFIAGDYYIVGTAAAHSASEQPFGCGKIIDTSLESEAFLFALKQVNDKHLDVYNNVFPSKRLGLILFNSCEQPIIIENHLSQLNRGNVTLNGIPATNYRKRIIGYVGASSSTLTVWFARMVDQLNSVSIGYAATSPALSDRVLYPTFLRTAPTDAKQFLAMAQFLSHFHWRYISVIYLNNNYGINAKLVLEERAREFNICIATELIWDDDNPRPIVLLERLRLHPSAKVVIVILGSQRARKFIQTINKRANQGEFIFIGSEAWGNLKTVTQGTDVAIGSFTFSVESQRLEKFETYMETRTPTDSVDNRLLLPFWQEYFKCNVAMSFDKPYSEACHPDLRLDASHNYAPNIWAPLIAQAVSSLAIGASQTIQDICSRTSRTGQDEICDEYRTKDGARNLYDNILKQTHSNSTRRIFDDEGNGNLGYVIHRIEPVNGGVDHQYVQIARWMDGILQFENEYKFLEQEGTRCPTDHDCAKCSMNNTARPSMNDCPASSTDQSDSWWIFTITIMVAIALMAVLFIGFIIFCWRPVATDVTVPPTDVQCISDGDIVDNDGYVTNMRSVSSSVHDIYHGDTALDGDNTSCRRADYIHPL